MNLELALAADAWRWMPSGDKSIREDGERRMNHGWLRK
jgi:hypothetical protein